MRSSHLRYHFSILLVRLLIPVHFCSRGVPHAWHFRASLLQGLAYFLTTCFKPKVTPTSWPLLCVCSLSWAQVILPLVIKGTLRLALKPEAQQGACRVSYAHWGKAHSMSCRWGSRSARLRERREALAASLLRLCKISNLFVYIIIHHWLYVMPSNFCLHSQG